MISLVLTTYNGEKYIVEQLTSLKNQSRKIDEVLIFDDQSTDHTFEVVQKFIDSNGLSDWKIKVNEKNKGWRRNFVEGANALNGDLIFFCDQDDIWMEHKVQMMADIMDQHEKIDVLAGKYIEFYDLPPETKGKTTNENATIYPVKQDSHLLYTELPGCVFCVRASFWKRIIKHWNGIFSHDGISWAAAKLCGSLYILDTPVIYWRKHYNSAYTITSRDVKTNNNRVKWLENFQKNLDCLKKIAEDLELPEEKCFQIERNERFFQLRIKMLKSHNPFMLFKLLKYLDCYNKKKQFLLEVYLSLRKN